MVNWKTVKKTTSSIVDTSSNIVTLGGHGKLKNNIKEYDSLYSKYLSSFQVIKSYNKKCTGIVELIGSETEDVFRTISKANKILYRNFNPKLVRDHQHLNNFVSVVMVSKFKSEISTVMDTVKGGVTSSAFTLGSWTLVSMAGTASTGAAIGGLSGAAATNATLAWFGGGSLAVGGGGMAAGSTMLTSLVAAPIIAYSAWKSYSKASEVAEEVEKLHLIEEEAYSHAAEIREQYDHYLSRYNILKKENLRCKETIRNVHSNLFPFGFLSMFYRWIKEIRTGHYYNESEVNYLHTLDNDVINLISLFQPK